MKSSSTAIIVAFVAILLQASVEAFSYHSNCPKQSIRSGLLSSLHYKNELLPDVEDEVLVSTKRGGNKKNCCNGCPGCPLANDSRNTEPNVLNEEKMVSKEASSINTNYEDANGEGLPLFHMAGEVGWTTMCEIQGYISLRG